MIHPGWLDGDLATLMLLIAASCAARPAIGRLRGRATEADADGLHFLMGLAMAAMLEPRLSPIPGTAWLIIFTAAAAWFAWQVIRARSGRPATPRCAHPVPHAVECAAMIYMLLPAGAEPAGYVPGTAMPAMEGPASAAAGNPVLALILALFMLGNILWATDRLTSQSRAKAPTVTSAGTGHQPTAGTTPATITLRPPGPASAASSGQAGRPPLAPKLAAGYKIAMSLGMGYMLLMML